MPDTNIPPDGLPPGTYELSSLFDPHVWFSIEMIVLAILVMIGLKFAEMITKDVRRR